MEKDGSFSIHHRKIQTLTIEIFKFLNGLSPQIVNKVFQVKSPFPYQLRDRNELCSRNSKTVTYGAESVSFMAPKIWSIVPQKLVPSAWEIKKVSISLFFQKCTRKWNPNCPCRLCEPTCNMLFFITISICGTGIKTFFICYLYIYVFYRFSPLKGPCWMVSLFIKSMNLQTVLCLIFFSSFLGTLTLIGFL